MLTHAEDLKSFPFLVTLLLLPVNERMITLLLFPGVWGDYFLLARPSLKTSRLI